jgi:phosphoglucosamine mutase
MRAGGYNLGGEQSGHIVFLDHNTTGDGAITCLQVLALLMEKGKRLSELKNVMTRMPQVLINVRVKEKRSFASMPGVQQTMAKIQKELKERGRMLVRYSGTEPLARVMLEGENEDKVNQMAAAIADAIRAEVGA